MKGRSFGQVNGLLSKSRPAGAPKRKDDKHFTMTSIASELVSGSGSGVGFGAGSHELWRKSKVCKTLVCLTEFLFN
jgi:hypothetical protein